MQMKHTKNLNPERFELGTTLSQPNRSINRNFISKNTNEVLRILKKGTGVFLFQSTVHRNHESIYTYFVLENWMTLYNISAYPRPGIK